MSNNNQNNQSYVIRPVKNGVIVTPTDGSCNATAYQESMVFNSEEEMSEFLGDEFKGQFESNG